MQGSIESWSRGKRIRFAVYTMMFAVLLLGIVLEIAFRILPTNEGLRAQPVNADQPVFHFEPNRDSTWSEGPMFDIINELATNNAGFVNDQDYLPADDPAVQGRPLLAVIGDSFIEAGIVPRDETLHARLQERLGNTGRVYSFAASGAGLAQYIAWARHVRDTYRPDMLVVLNISNDFSEALWHREHNPGFHGFERLPDGSAALRLHPYEPSLKRRLLRRSALVMYLVTNAKAHHYLDFDNLTRSLGAGDDRWSANIRADSTEEQFADYQWATDVFLDMLPDAIGLPPDRIVILTDAIRPQIYETDYDAEQIAGTTAAVMRNYMLTKAADHGISTINLEPEMVRRHRATGERFEFPTDGHWSGNGHRAAADMVAASPLFLTVFGNDSVSSVQTSEADD